MDFIFNRWKLPIIDEFPSLRASNALVLVFSFLFSWRSQWKTVKFPVIWDNASSFNVDVIAAFCVLIHVMRTSERHWDIDWHRSSTVGVCRLYVGMTPDLDNRRYKTFAAILINTLLETNFKSDIYVRQTQRIVAQCHTHSHTHTYIYMHIYNIHIYTYVYIWFNFGALAQEMHITNTT